LGRLRKKAAGKAREIRGVRRTLPYVASPGVEAQRSIRPFYEAVSHGEMYTGGSRDVQHDFLI
jgi:hypothetical protein